MISGTSRLSSLVLSHYGFASLESELGRLAQEGYSIVVSSLDGRDFREFASRQKK